MWTAPSGIGRDTHKIMRDHDRQTKNILMSDNPNMLGPNMLGPNMLGPNMLGPNKLGPNKLGIF